eukprot:scaffold1070_cov245-Pinguiococcus_pyrenoidosus.AAC.27
MFPSHKSIRGTGILLVYDVGDARSFRHVAHWMRQIAQNATDDVIKVICRLAEEDRDVADVDAMTLMSTR